MTDYAQDFNTGTGGIKTTSEHGDVGDGTDHWNLWIRSAILGELDSAAVTNPASDANVIALLKGLLTMIVAGTASSLLKLEDAAHASGDAGVQMLAVRRDTPTADAGTAGDYAHLEVDSTGKLWVNPKPTDLTVVNSAALEASHVLKASPGTLHAVVGYTTTAQYIQIHDATAVPANGAIPELSVPVAANTMFHIPLPGHVCSVGIVVCNSSTGAAKTIGAADTWFTGYVE